MRRFSFRQRPLVGLAVLPENIHLVQLKRTKKSVCLQRALTVSTPQGVMSEGRVCEFDMLKMVLAKLVQTEGLADLQAAVSVPVSQVKIQRMLIPAGLPQNDVEAEVMAEACRLLPANKEKITLDYHLQKTGRAEEQAVIFAAARDNYHERYAACLREAGLRPAIVDIDICALLRGSRQALTNVVTETEKIAVLSLHDSYAVMAAEYAGELLFHQHWDTRQTTTLMQWIEWCCQAYRQAGISVLAITGQQHYLSQAVIMISRHWGCKFYEVDPFAAMRNGGKRIPDNPSAFLLACGLALREPLSWLK